MNGDKFQLTIDKIFSSSVRNNPNQIISYMGKENVTYEQFRKRVYEIARGLVKIGVKKGDKVAVLEWDSMRYLEAYYAIPLAGGVLHTVERMHLWLNRQNSTYEGKLLMNMVSGCCYTENKMHSSMLGT